MILPLWSDERYAHYWQILSSTGGSCEIKIYCDDGGKRGEDEVAERQGIRGVKATIRYTQSVIQTGKRDRHTARLAVITEPETEEYREKFE